MFHSLHAGRRAICDLVNQIQPRIRWRRGGERPAGLGAGMERTQASEAKTAPENPICGEKWKRAGHCRKSNSSQKLVSSAFTPDGPGTALSAPAGPSPANTVDSNA